MSAAYTLSLIEKTNPEPYEQIIVLCQKMINEAFHNMWILADDDSPLTHFKYQTRSGEYIKTDLGPPKVQLQVTTQDPQLYYLLAMNKGSLKIYTTDDPDNPADIEWLIKDWVFAFSVKIGRKMITRDSPEYAKFKERAGLAESNFSLAQLFIDASSTTKWNEDLSTFGDKQSDWKSLGADARSTFETFIQKWLNLMSAKNQNILGYAAKPDSSEFNKYAPSFPATSIDYNNYQWLDPSALYPVPKDNIDQNAISYLMVGSFQNPPSPVGLPYSGTFVEENGLYCMNRKIFWGSWLLKQLGKVIKMMELTPDKPEVSYQADDHNYPWAVGIRLHVGNSSGADSDYVFQQSDNDSNSWSWDGSPKDTENIAYGDGDHERVHETATSWGSVKFDKGYEKVTVEGGNKFVVYVAHGSNENRWTRITVKGTWKFEIVMSAIQDGGVEFKKVPGSDSVSTKGDPPEGPLQWKNGVAQVVDAVKGNLDAQLEYGFPSVEENLLYALANQHKLFLPAAGTFLMKDPKFNKRGDLVVNLQYNGADPPTEPVKTKVSATPSLVSAEAPKPIGVNLAISSTHVALYSA